MVQPSSEALPFQEVDPFILLDLSGHSTSPEIASVFLET